MQMGDVSSADSPPATSDPPPSGRTPSPELNSPAGLRKTSRICFQAPTDITSRIRGLVLIFERSRCFM
ncbi:hypothetical protein F2P81_019622 [Scophthalmus maximus]|uniref:Uncharacterized protein n=1 Tax=Scophthalmus maximus TaxID=52904 RepID=A0A6A4S8A7_SCOMX|nr:hypothetical protein F2P81_019622 [Scophthalmus maximus]